ncbi:hypothetical protein BDV95DRAFT_536524 [Massariosphaeria phaeospora]|uniref:Uncharacterized protein n=1 Tax=Massariosphaeria phaeospora TaxID=100035 RepID=A0A7C8MC55_9PLEO|nr:hypothetical protein BDV95DRAFT_536524 [Massariosphaeria phaeospora]
MIRSSSLFRSFLICTCFIIWGGVNGQMIGRYKDREQLWPRQNGNGNNNNKNDNNNNNGPNTSAFNIENGRIFTPGLGIILAPQPLTPMGGDFLHIAIDVSGDGQLQVPPRNRDDRLAQVFNFTMFLTSNTLQKNFTISNITTDTPPLADIMNQEPGQTVKHINFEWPDCLVGDGQDNIEDTARGDYNITIHQNFRLAGSDHYSIFNLPISVTNSIQQFPGASQLLTKPPPGPLNANGGRITCDLISNPLLDISELVASVNNPPGQPYRDIAIETAGSGQGGQIGDPGNANPNANPNNPNSNNPSGNGEGIGARPGGGSQGELGDALKNASGRYWAVLIMAAMAVLGDSALS